MKQSGPVLITGSPRAGTSIFFLALKRATNLPGHNEGHLLPLYSSLDKMVVRHFTIFAARAADPRCTIGHITPREVSDGILSFLLEMCNKIHGSDTWIDKSTGVPMLDFIRALAAYGVPFTTFFMYRRALENVFSRLKKFPQHDFRCHVEDWVNIMARWRDIRSELPENSFAEIDQKDIADQPEKVAESAATVLALSTEEQQIMAKILKTKRPQQLASESVGRVLSLESVGWSAEHRKIFVDIAGEELEKWGFSLVERYRVA